jgi:hypothetical protein
MPPRAGADAATNTAGTPIDPFQELDREFEAVQRGLIRGGLDEAAVHELGPQVMLALWSATPDRLGVPAPTLEDLAAQLAQVLRASSPDAA